MLEILKMLPCWSYHWLATITVLVGNYVTLLLSINNLRDWGQNLSTASLLVVRGDLKGWHKEGCLAIKLSPNQNHEFFRQMH